MMVSSMTNAHFDRVVPMRVIVCGVQRTGTLSIRHALYQLGFHDCYHMHSVRDNPEEDGPQWVRAFEAKYAGKGTFEKKDWDGLLGESQAVCDVPAAFFGPELAECYPDAKVVILNRDPEKWYDSVLNSIHSETPLAAKMGMIFCLAFDSVTRAWVRFAMAMRNNAFDFDHRTEKGKALGWFKRMYGEFRERIPQDRRIEYTMGDGWGPLCDHLGVPVPMVRDEADRMVEAPFPHVNDRSSFHVEMKEWRQRAIGRSFDTIWRLVGKAAVTGSTAYVGYLMWKTRVGGRF